MMTHHFLSQELNFAWTELGTPSRVTQGCNGLCCFDFFFFFFCWSQQKNTTFCPNLGIISDKNVTSVMIRLLPFLADWSFSEFFQRGILHQLVQIVENCENNASTKASFTCTDCQKPSSQWIPWANQRSPFMVWYLLPFQRLLEKNWNLKWHGKIKIPSQVRF